MPGSRCAQCGREEFLPFRCRFCSQPHCLEHRLPENHACPNLSEYRARAREERPLGTPEPDRPPLAVRTPSRASNALGTATQWFTRSMTHKLLGAILLVYVGNLLLGVAVGMATGAGAGDGIAWSTCRLAMGSCSGEPWLQSLLGKPWSPLTSIFLHLSPIHLFFNAIILFFFVGPMLEVRVGPRKMLWVFLASGAVAAIAQDALVAGFPGLFGRPGPILGASGGLMGLLGVLTILAPQARVLLLFAPVPLWVVTVFFVILDVMGLFNPGSGIANMAHLGGLAVGLLEGERLRRRGVLPRITATWAGQRRW